MSTSRPAAPTATHYLWLAHALFLLTFYGSLIPLRYEPMPIERAVERFREIGSFDPSLLGARGDWVVNMVQYASMSFCYMAAMCVDRRRVVGLVAVAAIVPACCAAAFALEFLQLYFPPRTVSTNDLIVECLGSALGAVAWLIAGQGLTDWLRRFGGRRGVAGLASQALPAYLILLIVVLGMPFDVVVGVDELAQKHEIGRIQWLPFRSLASGGLGPALHQLTNLAAFFPLGFLLGLTPRWRNRGWRSVLAFGLGVGAAFEILQLFVFTRSCDTTDLVSGTAAVLLGWWAARALLARISARPGESSPTPRRILAWSAPWGGRVSSRMLLIGWAGLLVLISWQPFDFTADPAKFRDSDPSLTDENTAVVGLRRLTLAPFVDYYWGSRYDALDQAVRRSLSFAPLGVLVALGTWRRRGAGAARVIAVSLAVGTVIEAGQYFIPDRHPSTTDLLIQAAGAWLAFAMTRHVMLALDVDATPSDEGRPRSGTAETQSWASGSQHRTSRGPRIILNGKPPSAARATHWLAGRFGTAIAWLDARPYGVRLIVVGVSAVALSLGAVLLARVLGLI